MKEGGLGGISQICHEVQAQIEVKFPLDFVRNLLKIECSM